MAHSRACWAKTKCRYLTWLYAGFAAVREWVSGRAGRGADTFAGRAGLSLGAFSAAAAAPVITTLAGRAVGLTKTRAGFAKAAPGAAPTVAGAAVLERWMAACTRCRGAGTRRVAVVEGLTDDMLCGGANTGQASIVIGACVSVVAHDAVGPRHPHAALAGGV